MKILSSQKKKIKISQFSSSEEESLKSEGDINEEVEQKIITFAGQSKEQNFLE